MTMEPRDREPRDRDRERSPLRDADEGPAPNLPPDPFEALAPLDDDARGRLVARAVQGDDEARDRLFFDAYGLACRALRPEGVAEEGALAQCCERRLAEELGRARRAAPRKDGDS